MSDQNAHTQRFDPETLAYKCVRICEQHRGWNVCLYDTQGASLLADYFLICSADSEPQIRGMASHLEQELKHENVYSRHTEGMPRSHWLIIDYGAVVVHIFEPDLRDYYELEDLWTDYELVYRGAEEPEY